MSDIKKEKLLIELCNQGYGVLVNKKQYAEIMGCSVSTVNTRISQGLDLPKYIKDGKSKNAKVLFRLSDVADFILRNTVEVA